MRSVLTVRDATRMTNPSYGLTTKLSAAAVAVLTLVAAVLQFVHGDHSAETADTIQAAVAVLVGLTLSRGYQAGQITKTAGAGTGEDYDPALDEPVRSAEHVAAAQDTMHTDLG